MEKMENYCQEDDRKDRKWLRSLLEVWKTLEKFARKDGERLRGYSLENRKPCQKIKRKNEEKNGERVR